MPSTYSMMRYAMPSCTSKSYTCTMDESESFAAVRASSSPGTVEVSALLPNRMLPPSGNSALVDSSSGMHLMATRRSIRVSHADITEANPPLPA